MVAKAQCPKCGRDHNLTGVSSDRKVRCRCGSVRVQERGPGGADAVTPTRSLDSLSWAPVRNTRPMNSSTPAAARGMPAQFGRYRILKKLGQGGMGIVFLAHDSHIDRPVALKLPHRSAKDGPDVWERLQREARAAATLEHPNICPLYDAG